ncbi:radical s-adenosyl methionine domain-containing protein 2 [Glomus cerebriforme]|uniref:Radical s-adenosyl methionine domain-containing protein 2 n=1 Tax=Glomus cerebriforme TaxID=658196 RepID=A0A397SWB6_9GLOM|nr:radical s-adenosyl methionine domain-containing protein 2 [Glomus cerebriforme]
MFLKLLITLFIIVIVSSYVYPKHFKRKKNKIQCNTKRVPLSVNFHFTRQCNYECGFCFHTAKTSHLSSINDAKLVLKKLANEGMKKINFAGGEPFLYPKYLEELIRFCKQELMLESVSIVSNGSKIKQTFLQRNKDYLDILAISCDSFNESTNKKIGRGTGQHVAKLCDISQWCHELGIKFKLNTVVNAYNKLEDMNDNISKIAPFRWKCFQVLILENENGGGEGTLRDAREFIITDQEFEEFIKRHSGQACIVPEPNNLMKNSYLILDEYLRFLNCTNNDKTPSESLLDVPVEKALMQAGWDQEAFIGRSGIYDWSRQPSNICGSNQAKELAW